MPDRRDLLVAGGAGAVALAVVWFWLNRQQAGGDDTILGPGEDDEDLPGGGDDDEGDFRMPPGMRTLFPNDYIVLETDDLDSVSSGGTVTLSPGETKTLVEYTGPSPVSLMAVGATDAADTEYQLYIDNQRVVGGTTNSPLGTLNDPFSFIQMFDGAIPAGTVEYRAHRRSSASGDADLAGRLHLEVIG